MEWTQGAPLLQQIVASRATELVLLVDASHVHALLRQSIVKMGSYYNIDDILTDAQKVPCTFSLDIPGLGFLDDHTGGDVKPPQNKTPSSQKTN